MRPRSKTFIRGMFRTVSVSALLGIFGGLALLVVLLVSLTKSLPPVTALKDYQHSHATQVFSDDGKKIGEFTTEKRYPVPFEKIPRHVIEAFLAAELLPVGLQPTFLIAFLFGNTASLFMNTFFVQGIPLPEKLFQVDQRKIVGLIIDPQALVTIRRERLLKMGEDPTGSYANLEHVMSEIEYCKEIYRKNRRWPVFDVTNKALEETASEIEKSILNAMPEKYGG